MTPLATSLGMSLDTSQGASLGASSLHYCTGGNTGI